MFPARTAQTFDGFHPRHYLLLSDQLLTVLATLLRCIELHGRFPSALEAVFTNLIPKHKSDSTVKLRGIGFCVSLYRICGKLRQSEALDWEQRHPLKEICHQKGKSILEIVFAQSLAAEHGQYRNAKLHTSCVLWDMSNFYEHVRRQILWQRAQASGFNMRVLTVILNMYQARRLVGLNER